MRAMSRKLILSALLIFLSFAVVSSGISFLASLTLVRRNILESHSQEMRILLDQTAEQEDRIRERMVILTSGEGISALVEACLKGETAHGQREALSALEEHLGLLLYLNPELDRIFIYSGGYVFAHEKETGASIMLEASELEGHPDTREMAAFLNAREIPMVPEKLLTLISRNGLALFASRRSLFDFVRSGYSLGMFDPRGKVVERTHPMAGPEGDVGLLRSGIERDRVRTVTHRDDGYTFILESPIGVINSRIRRSGWELLILLGLTGLAYSLFCRFYALRLMEPLKEMEELFDRIGSYDDKGEISDFSSRLTGVAGMRRRVFAYYRTAIFPLLFIILFSSYSFYSVISLNRRQSEIRLLGLLSDSMGKTLSGYEVLTKYLSLSESIQDIMSRDDQGMIFDELSGILVRSGVFSLDIYGVNFYNARGVPLYAGGTISFQESKDKLRLALDGIERTGVIINSRPGQPETISYISRILQRPRTESSVPTYEPIGFVELVMKNFIPGKLSLVSQSHRTLSGFVREGTAPESTARGYLMGRYPVANTNLEFYLGIARDGGWGNQIQIILLNLVIMLLQIIAVLILSRAMEARILTPLAGLNDYIRAREKGTDSFDVPSRDNEFVRLADSFNSMMERLQKLSRELAEQEVRTHRSELIALQAQINPHFFNNIIASILLLMRNGKTDDAMGMLAATGRHFQGKIFGDRRFITLAEEISHLRNYVEIQNYRFGGGITLNLETRVDTDRYYLPRLLLQPLVENAISHGMKDGQHLIIAVVIELNGPVLAIGVRDNGRGLDEARLEEVRLMMASSRTSRHYGLSNVSDRLRLLSSDTYRFEIFSVQDTYTRVELDLPVREESHA